MKSIQEDIDTMETQIEHWGTKLDGMLAKLEALGEDAKSDGRKRIKELKAKHAAARAKLDELEAAGSEKWEVLKGGLENAWGELETAFVKLAS